MLKSVYYWLNGIKTQISLETLKFEMPAADIEIAFECEYAPPRKFSVEIFGADDDTNVDKYTVKVNGETLSNKGYVNFQPGSLKFEIFDDKGNTVPWENVSYIRLCDSKNYNTVDLNTLKITKTLKMHLSL